MEIENGAIVDVYPEGLPTYRACVLDVVNEVGLFYVIALIDGSKGYADSSEIMPTIITNIFKVE